MKYIEASNLPEKDKVYLKRDIFGWRVVQPIKNSDGRINWLNLTLGGFRNAIFLLGILLIIGFLMWAHFHDVKAIKDNYGKIASDPIGWCKDVNKDPSSAYGYARINWSDLNISGSNK